MGKIAAVILPAEKGSNLEHLCDKMGDSLCQADFHKVEKRIYNGNKAVCGLIRIGPDSINPVAQPLQADRDGFVSCGYYLSSLKSGNNDTADVSATEEWDSATHLFYELATVGEQQLPFGDGVYAFAWWDGINERLVAGVDKLGMRPLFWTAIEGGGYAVASEIKALLPLISDPSINWAAWEEYLTLGFLLGTHSPFEQIAALGAAQVIKCRPHNHSTAVVENFLENIKIVERSSVDFLAEQHEVFGRAMEQLFNLIPEECDPMLTLSGGYDSRRILGWLMSKDAHFDAYTVPHIQPDGTEHESGIVSALCSQFRIPLHLIYPSDVEGRRLVSAVRDFSTDFQSDEHPYPTMLAMALDGHNKINFDGLAGDMIVSGLYLKPHYFHNQGKQSFIEDLHIGGLHRVLSLPSTQPPLMHRVQNELHKWTDHPNRFTYFYMMSRTRREIALAPFMIQANTVESLCPYLDRHFMINGLSLPPWEKLEAPFQRPLIQAYDDKLLDVATTHDAGVSQNLKYVTTPSDIQKAAKLKQLRQVTRSLAQRHEWIPNAIQKRRFFMAGYLHKFLSEDFTNWELGKAERIAALIRFSESAQSQQKYLNDSSLLKSKFCSRPAWERLL
jgi:asparagine synthetase B (glutamine-hydrolysing)